MLLKRISFWPKYCLLLWYFVPTYNVYCLEICQFFDGYVDSTRDEDLDDVNTEQECAALVKTERPHARGATWYKSGPHHYRCKAEFGTSAKIVYVESYPHHRGCLFSGIHIYYK